MQSSSISSRAETTPATDPPIERLALTGRSVRIDPRVDAVRPDLADVRLAHRIFAPHYAAPMPCLVAQATALRATPDAGAEILAQLEPGERFEVLELTGGHGWGIAVAHRLVGYIDVAALGEKL